MQSLLRRRRCLSVGVSQARPSCMGSSGAGERGVPERDLNEEDGDEDV